MNTLKMVTAKELRAFAYHEAGHGATTAFFGEDYLRFEKITIIPDEYNCASILFSEPFRFTPIECFPIKGGVRWVKGICFIILNLSGPIAEMISMNEPGPYDVLGAIEYDLSEIRIEKTDEEYQIERNTYLQKFDEGRSLVLARQMQMQKKNWPPHRILRMVEKWTYELLMMPDVWNVVDALAQRLMEVREITNIDEYHDFCRPIEFRWSQYPIWKRRFRIKKSELGRG